MPAEGSVCISVCRFVLLWCRCLKTKWFLLQILILRQTIIIIASLRKSWHSALRRFALFFRCGGRSAGLRSDRFSPFEIVLVTEAFDPNSH